jgi:hypothetical protein
MIQELMAEKRRLDQVIAFLEALDQPLVGEQQPKPAKALRGRKWMSPAERQEVSERMRRYWATRKEQNRASRPYSAGV